MTTMSWQATEELGYQLWTTGFRPLPDVDDDGRLTGVRMWRLHSGYLEYLALREPGTAAAGRTVARFSFRDPFRHGPVVEHDLGNAVDTLAWLLEGTAPPREPVVPPLAGWEESR